MEKLVINCDLLDDDILTILKARAILFNSKNKILAANYNGIFMLPGGKLDEGETFMDAVLREVAEETGGILGEDDVEPFLDVVYYQKEFPSRNLVKLIERLSLVIILVVLILM